MIYNRANLSVSKLVDKKKTAGGMDCVHFRKNMTKATNGHYLVRITTPEIPLDDIPAGDGGLGPMDKDKAEGIDFLVPPEKCKEIAASIPKKSRFPILSNAWLGAKTGEEKIEFITTDLESWKPTIFTKTDLKYHGKVWGHHTDSVVEKYDKEKSGDITVTLNAEYVKRIAGFLSAAGAQLFNLRVRGPQEPIKMTAENVETGQKIVAILMPVTQR